jgi:hypothetical protein
MPPSSIGRPTSPLGADGQSRVAAENESLNNCRPPAYHLVRLPGRGPATAAVRTGHRVGGNQAGHTMQATPQTTALSPAQICVLVSRSIRPPEAASGRNRTGVRPTMASKPINSRDAPDMISPRRTLVFWSCPEGIRTPLVPPRTANDGRRRPEAKPARKRSPPQARFTDTTQPTV